MDTITGNISPLGIKVSGLISQSVLRGYSAYQVAKQNGFDGTIEEWLYSLRGESIEFKSEGLKIYYKYESDTTWNLLVEIDQLLADYDVLDNKPSINDVELNGNKTLDDLGIQAKGNYVEERNGYSMVSDQEIQRLSGVDNYDDSEIRQAIEAIVLAAVTGVKGSAENDFRRGNVTITPANLGLGNVDNTHDINKNVHSAVQDSEGNKIDETYFSGISQSGGEVYLTRPDGSSTKLMNSEHTHDASEITSGTIDIARLPAAALERMIDVADRTARYALTKSQVQNGDTVRQLDTGIMYRVVDDTKLNKSDGYKEYTAGRAAAVPWSGVEDKPTTFTPSAHTHEISQITDIANASVAEAAKLKTPRSISISGGATASAVQFDGTGNVNLNVTDIDGSLLSGTANISITGNAGTATQFARERTIEVTGKATAAPKVYDGRQNIALEITALDAAEINHTHTMSDITDLDPSDFSATKIDDFSTSNTDNYTDVWFSDHLVLGKPVHNSGVQYNPYRNILKAGSFQGALLGNASTASALTTNAGSATHPVYFSNGVPVATTYELNASVPADAVFTDTDTHYASNIVVAGNFNSKVDTSSALTNGNVFINHIENDRVTSSHKITGTGSTTVTTDEYGNIIVNATGASYTQGAGISISDLVISNSGVRGVSESSENGNITANINGTAINIPVHGLKSAAYTDSTDYAMSNHKHSFSDLQNKPTTLQGYGITDAAASSHEHDASEITSGTIDIARLPAGALQRLITVSNQAARFALTKSQVQNGDTVQQEDTGVMYRVIDDTKLDRAAGYKEYTAGIASSVPWAGITGKPESFIPATHTHTASDISDIATATVGKANQLATARTISLTGAVTGSGSFDGSENLSINTTVNHTHQYAGSQTIGGAANEAVKLTTSAGSASYPVYFYEGKPVALSHQLNATVPADAVFTDTHYSSSTVINSAEDSTSNSTRAISNGNVFLNHVENGSVKSSHRIIGTGVVTVTYNVDGDLVINGIGVDPEFIPTLYSLSINGKTYDGSAPVDAGIIDVAHGGTGNSTVDSAPTQDSTRMVTSGGVYTALAGKASSSHTHSYAGSSIPGGSATTAEALNPLTDAGSATQPIFFSSGKPASCTYALNKTVPADAVFTDTHYQAKNVVAGNGSAITDTSSILSNGSVYLNLVENSEVRSSHKISGSGDVTVKTDSSGNIIIHCTDTDTKYSPGTGIDISGTTISNTGVRSISQGLTNGTISVNTGGTSAEISVKGLGTAAYTDSSAYASSSHTHSYAGSSSAGGSATSAVKLDSDAGSATQPVFFSSGKPTACTYSLNKTVPADAVFTDSHYTSVNVVNSTNDSTTDTSSSLSNTHVFLNHVENGAVTSSHRISGTGSTTVTTDSLGNIIINSSDTKYTELPNPYSLTIQAGGTSLGTYDGSQAKSFNITYSNVGAAAASHSHNWSDLTTHPTTLAGYGITDQLASKTHIHDASEIQSGVLDIARIPVGALERLITVDDLTEMYTLTVNDVQLGDTVQCEDTGIMYRVVDVSNLDNANGYKEYTAGSAASVPWSGITGKPQTFTPSSHTHMYAASASYGGSALSAEKLTSNGGSATQPIYFSGGKPTACTYELNATVPANAEFTDTHHQAKLITTNSASSTTQSTSALTNTNVFMNVVENGAVRSSHRISGGGDIKVTTDNNGNINIGFTETKYTVLPNPQALIIKGNGTTLGTYYGNEEIEIDIDYADVGAAAASHGTHVTYSTTAPSANGTASAGSASTVARSDHVHPLQTSVSGNAGSADKLNSAITISLSGAVTGSQQFDGSDNITIATTLASHTHDYAGSSTPGGAATSANKLNTNAGNASTPVYFSNGIPVEITSYGGAAAQAGKLQVARSLVVDLERISSASVTTTFNGQKNLDGSDNDHPAIPIKGTLGVAHGGTGNSTLTANGILYGNGTGNVGVTLAGTAGAILTANGDSAPSWTTPNLITAGKASTLSTGRKLLVGLGTANTVGEEFNGSADITIPVSGTLSVAHGGTGLDTLTAYGVLYGNGTNAIGAVAQGSAGQVLKANGVAAPTWEDQANLVAGSADKLSASRTISLAVASGANGGVTGSVTTNFNGNVTIDTSLSTHTHNAETDITDGILPPARGGTGYGTIDLTPTSGSPRMVQSGGVHRRIAYKKFVLDPTAWSLYDDLFNSTDVYRLAMATGSDIAASTEIVSVKLEGSMINDQTVIEYSQEFTGDGTTQTFTLDHTPSHILSVTNAGVSTSNYTISGNQITVGEATNSGAKLAVVYDVVYNNDLEFSKLNEVETGAAVVEFRAYSRPLVNLTVVVGFVAETLETHSTQAASLLPDGDRFDPSGT